MADAYSADRHSPFESDRDYANSGIEGVRLAGWDPAGSEIYGDEQIKLRFADDLGWQSEAAEEGDKEHIVWRYDLRH